MMRTMLVSTAVLAVARAEIYMKEKFSSDSLDGWESSFWKGETCTDDWQTAGRKSCMGKWEVTSGSWAVDAEEQKGLRTTENMAFHAISKQFDKPFSNRKLKLVKRSLEKPKELLWAYKSQLLEETSSPRNIVGKFRKAFTV